jgi:peptide/nickel transport system ATP-binding protein
MYLGQCIEKAPSAEPFKDPLHPYTKALLSAIPVIDIEHKREKRQILRGEVSSPINPPPGCRFAPRCALKKDSCLESNAGLREVRPGRFVACDLVDIN